MNKRDARRAFGMLNTHAKKFINTNPPLPVPTGTCNEWLRVAWEPVLAYTANLSPEALGLIASSGGGVNRSEMEYQNEGYNGTSLYSVHCADFPDKYASGRSILEQIAATALIARLYDFLRESHSDAVRVS